MPLMNIFFCNKMRRDLLLSSFLLIVFFIISNKAGAQNFETDKRRLGESLLELYSGKDSISAVDDFFEKNAFILNCNKRGEKFFGVETAFYSPIRNRRLNNYFFADSLGRYFKSILPADFDEQMLKKQQSKYDIVYLLLKNIAGDTASVNNFITTRLNEQTEIETVVFINSLFKQYFKNLFPSILTENERSFRTDYSDIYSKDAYEELLTTGKWDKGEAAAYIGDILISLYVQEYLKMNTANDFMKLFYQADNLFKKAFYLDIALSKKISMDSAIGIILKSHLEDNFKIFAIDQTLKQTHRASIIDTCNKALRQFCNKIKYPVVAPKTVLENNNASNFFTYSGLVGYCCANRTIVADSFLQQLQSKSRYNWGLFTQIVNNRLSTNNDFVKRHIKTLASIPGDFFKKKKNAQKDYPVFVYPSEWEYSPFLPKNFLWDRSVNQDSDAIDSLFEKLFTVPEYLEQIKNSFMYDSSSNDNKMKRFSKTSLVHIFKDSATNFLERGYAIYFMLTEQPKLIPAIMKNISAIKTKAGLFKMAALFNTPDKLNYLSKEFERTLKIFRIATGEGDSDEQLFYITTALEYFKGRETKMFYKIVTQFLSDTTNSYKLASIILNQYPQFFYDDRVINNSKRIWYLEGLSKFFVIQTWENIVPILNPTDKKFVRDLFYRSRS